MQWEVTVGCTGASLKQETEIDFKEALGIRRSIRYFDPDRPVEREKILEAMRIASCAVNAHWLRAVVVNKEDIPKATREALKTPVAALVQELSPVHIYCYMDLGVVRRIKGTRLKELIDAGALNPTHGWSYAFVDEVVYPSVLEPLTQNPAYPAASAFERAGRAPKAC